MVSECTCNVPAVLDNGTSAPIVTPRIAPGAMRGVTVGPLFPDDPWFRTAALFQSRRGQFCASGGEKNGD